MQTRRILVWTAVGLLVLAGLVYGFMPRPLAVDVAEVARGPLTVTVLEEGRTRVIDRFVVSAPVAGFARRIELDVGDHVGDGPGEGGHLVLTHDGVGVDGAAATGDEVLDVS